MATFQLLIANLLTFRLALTLDSGASTPICTAFDLTAKRVPLSEFLALFDGEEGDRVKATRAFLLKNVTGWAHQQLIGDETGKPAAFSAEALTALLDIMGVQGHIMDAYSNAIRVKTTEAGRAGNLPSPR